MYAPPATAVKGRALTGSRLPLAAHRRVLGFLRPTTTTRRQPAAEGLVGYAPDRESHPEDLLDRLAWTDRGGSIASQAPVLCDTIIQFPTFSEALISAARELDL